MWCLHDGARFFENNILLPKYQSLGFFELIGKFRYYFFLNLVYNESLYQLLYARTNLIFGDILVPKMWTKKFL